MAKSVFKDDSSPADKRNSAVTRLLSMCPASYRLIMQPFVESAVEKCSDAEISALLIDAQQVETLANSGDWNSVLGIARKYGATDGLINQFAPGLLDANAR
jgi:hypothetical protein